jgi:hypothetical protein
VLGVTSDVVAEEVPVAVAAAVGVGVGVRVPGVGEAAEDAVELGDPVGSAAAVTLDPARRTASTTTPSANRSRDAATARVGRRMGVLVLGNDPEVAI